MNTRASWPAGRFPAEAALLTDGQQALALRLALIAGARQRILLQTYSWESDRSGNLLLGALLAAARRGVEVWLLVDDFYAGRNRYLEGLVHEPGVRVRLFNPFWLRRLRGWSWPLELLCRFRRLNHRMHNKLLVVDEQWAVVGGRNVGDGYFGLPAPSEFVDLELLLRGDVCRPLAQGFMRYWHSRWSQPLRHLHWWALPARLAAAQNAFLLSLTEPDIADCFALPSAVHSGCWRTLRWHAVQAQVVMDAPAKASGGPPRPGAAAGSLLQALPQVQHSLEMVTPYLVPTRHLYRAWYRLARRGVQLRLLTNTLATTDMPLADAGWQQRRPRLQALGAILHELRPHGARCLHAKLALLDGRQVLMGSLNLDPRSLYLNTELAVLVEGEGLLADLRDWLAHWQAPAQSGATAAVGSAAEGALAAWRARWTQWWWRLMGRLPIHHLL